MHAPVDATLLKSLCATAFNSFLEGLRSAVLSGTMWTLHVEGVQVLYRGGFVDDDDEEWADGEWLRGDDDDFDALDAGLAAFFGADAMRRPPWVQAWCNAYGRPPVTRIRDIADMIGRRPYSFNLTDRSAKAPAAVINVGFDDDIQAVEQPDIHNPTGPPAFMQLGPGIRPAAPRWQLFLAGRRGVQDPNWKFLGPGSARRISFYLPRYLPPKS